MDSLHTVDPDSAGPLSREGGGFGVAMWENTSRMLVDSLLGQLPVNTASPAMRDLMRRLLLSNAAAPRGASEGGSLVALRASLLTAMGDLEGVELLLATVPQRGSHEELERVETDTRFLANDNARACRIAAGRIGETDNPYWQKALIFCQALAGEYDKASLGVALLREMGETDRVFLGLMDVLTGAGTTLIESLPEPAPIHLAMARAARVPLPADIIAANRPAVLANVARSPNAPLELRLEAAERAQAAGAYPVKTLRELYASVPFSEADMANPLSTAEEASGPVGRALLFGAAQAQTVPMAQAEVVARALAMAREGGRYPSTVRTFMPVLTLVSPSTELAWFAPEAIRALLVGGQHDLARQWFDLLRSSAAFNPDSQAALFAVMPLGRLAGSSEAGNWTTADLVKWWELNRESENVRQRAALFYSLFEGLGEAVPEALWEALLDGPPRVATVLPHAALWFRLQTAAAASRIGETVLLSLLALGEGGPNRAEPVVMRGVLAGLGAVGLESEARALAVEAAVVAGL